MEAKKSVNGKKLKRQKREEMPKCLSHDRQGKERHRVHGTSEAEERKRLMDTQRDF